MDRFLDKLMQAESGGRATAKNPRSTALGPYQFIDSTFLALVDRHFDDEVEGLSQAEVLALRTDHGFARRAVEVFTKENADYLEAQGVAVTFPGLRLAHLLGAAGAATVLKAEPGTALHRLFPQAVLRANPFMRKLTAAGLVRRAERELGVAGEEEGEPEARPERTSLVQPAAARIEEPEREPRTVARRARSRAGAPVRAAARAASRARAQAGRCRPKAASCRKLASGGKRKMRVAGN